MKTELLKKQMDLLEEARLMRSELKRDFESKDKILATAETSAALKLSTLITLLRETSK